MKALHVKHFATFSLRSLQRNDPTRSPAAAPINNESHACPISMLTDELNVPSFSGKALLLGRSHTNYLACVPGTPGLTTWSQARSSRGHSERCSARTPFPRKPWAAAQETAKNKLRQWEFAMMTLIYHMRGPFVCADSHTYITDIINTFVGIGSLAVS